MKTELHMKSLSVLIVIIGIIGCNSMKTFKIEESELVDSLNLRKYEGTWYEIARLPFRAEKDLVNVTATYTITPDNNIKVVNKGYKNSPDGKLSKIEGKAWRPDENIPGRLKVRFFWPFSATYNVLALDHENYEYALVGSATGKYGWVLSRKPGMDESLYNKLLAVAEKKGLNADRFQKVEQQW